MYAIVTVNQAVSLLKGASSLQQLWANAKLIARTLDVAIDVRLTIPGAGRFHVAICGGAITINRVD